MWFKKLACLVVVFLLSAGCAKVNTEYAHYVPLRFDGNRLVEDNALKTKAHLDRVEQVLSYYNIQYERVDDLSIRFSSPMDADYMWNMTTKAEDKEWVQDHQIKNGT